MTTLLNCAGATALLAIACAAATSCQSDSTPPKERPRYGSDDIPGREQVDATKMQEVQLNLGGGHTFDADSFAFDMPLPTMGGDVPRPVAVP